MLAPSEASSAPTLCEAEMARRWGDTWPRPGFSISHSELAAPRPSPGQPPSPSPLPSPAWGPHTCHDDGGKPEEHAQRHLLQSRGEQLAPQKAGVQQAVLHGHQDQQHHHVGQEEPGLRDLARGSPERQLAGRRSSGLAPETGTPDCSWVTQSQLPTPFPCPAPGGTLLSCVARGGVGSQ